MPNDRLCVVRGVCGDAASALESMQPNAISDRALWDLITGSTAQRVGAAQIIACRRRCVGERSSHTGLESVGLAMSEVDELRPRGRGLGGLLEVVESR